MDAIFSNAQPVDEEGNPVDLRLEEVEVEAEVVEAEIVEADPQEVEAVTAEVAEEEE
jgi:hypothetical protein